MEIMASTQLIGKLAEETPPLMGEIFGTLGLILALAFIVQSLTEALFGRVMDHFPVLQAYKWTLVYLAVAVGIVGSFVYQFDFMFLLGRFAGSPVDKTIYGIVITGISIGMGASYVHQLISKFFPPRAGSGSQSWG